MRPSSFFLFSLLFLLPPLFAFRVDPYFTDLGEFHLSTSYTYRTYPVIEGIKEGASYHSGDRLGKMALRVMFWPNWEGAVDLDLAKTTHLGFGVERTGIQVRRLLLDDIVGDPFSLAVGGQLFFVPTGRLQDPSTPYHARENIEIGISAGKEIDRFDRFRFRLFAFCGVGRGRCGSPWFRLKKAIGGKIGNAQRWGLFGEGLFGTGDEQRIDPDRFRGYGNIAHRSVDLGVEYGYLFGTWGSLHVKYAYRVYVHAFPGRASLLQCEYRLPFSVL